MYTKTELKKAIIAHELGHALHAKLADENYMPTFIQFVPEVNEAMLAYCDMQFGARSDTVLKKTGFLGISDLGGAFGEMLYSGQWNPWGCRGDFDNFLTGNKKKTRSGLFNELDRWFWLDVGPLSFHRMCQGKFHDRYFLTLSLKQTKRALPLFFGLYGKFEKYVDIDKFMDAVDALHDQEVRSIDHKHLEKIYKDLFMEGTLNVKTPKTIKNKLLSRFNCLEYGKKE